MKLLLVGCNYRTAPIEMREKLAFDGPKLPAALAELETRYGCEAVILSTCNRVELYLARAHDQPLPEPGVIAEFLCEVHGQPAASVQPLLYAPQNADAVKHLEQELTPLVEGSRLSVTTTGPAGIGRDLNDAAYRSLDDTTIATLVLVVVTLLLVYRSPVLALVRTTRQPRSVRRNIAWSSISHCGARSDLLSSRMNGTDPTVFTALSYSCSAVSSVARRVPSTTRR